MAAFADSNPHTRLASLFKHPPHASGGGAPTSHAEMDFHSCHASRPTQSPTVRLQAIRPVFLLAKCAKSVTILYPCSSNFSMNCEMRNLQVGPVASLCSFGGALPQYAGDPFCDHVTPSLFFLTFFCKFLGGSPLQASFIENLSGCLCFNPTGT